MKRGINHFRNNNRRTRYVVNIIDSCLLQQELYVHVFMFISLLAVYLRVDVIMATPQKRRSILQMPMCNHHPRDNQDATKGNGEREGGGSRNRDGEMRKERQR